MDPILITLLMFMLLAITLALGVPLTFTLGGIGLLCSLFLWGPKSMSLVSETMTESSIGFILVAMPCYILMALFLEKSGLAEDLYTMMHRWFGGLRGGLAVGTVIICAIFAAMSGISGPATVTMGLIALPSMLKRNYNSKMAVGCISAGGALGILIPPSTIMIIYGSLVQVSVGKLFMSGVFPGLLLAGLFCFYIIIRCFLQPQLGPALPKEERASWPEKLDSLKAVILPILLIILVLGVIFTGIATPSEAAAVGAFGAFLCTIIHRRFSWEVFRTSAASTIKMTAMIMWIIFGAKVFASVYIGLGAPALIQSLVADIQLNRWVVLFIMQLTFFILGCFIDPVGIVSICAPVFVPVATSLGFDPVWYGCLFVINMEMAYITPPFGFNLFYMKAIVPPSITMKDVYMSVWPFVAIQALCLLIVAIFPQIALWLPGQMAAK